MAVWISSGIAAVDAGRRLARTIALYDPVSSFRRLWVSSSASSADRVGEKAE